MIDELEGRTLGQYTIKSLLGKGGMAKVYIAHQSSMNRDVAIKVMHVEMSAQAQLVTRFKQEASLIAQLEHPHILPVFDFGQEGALLFIVMRLVRGESLDQRLRQGPLKASVALEMLKQIGSALEFAHERGVIHRDLKPSNVLLDEHDNTYLADFGIAKLITSEQQLTDTHSVLGTPHYMAPEQWRAEKIDGRTDVYSLGIMAYQMLTGQLPFSAETPFHIMHHHVNTPPPPLPTEMLEEVPAALGDIIHKALAKDPTQRYQTAREMVDALAEVSRGTTTNVSVPATTSDFGTQIGSQDDLPTMATDPFEVARAARQPHLTAHTQAERASETFATAVEVAAPISKTGFWRNRTLWLAGAVILVAVLAGVGFLLSQEEDQPNGKTNTVRLLTTPIREIFDGNTLGWDRNESNRYLADGKYHMLALTGEEGSGLSLAQGMLPLADGRVEVEVEDLSQTDSQITYAVLWRVQDSSNYYRFTVTSDGQAGIVKRVAGEDIPLTTTTLSEWDDSQRLHRLKVEMVGAEIVAYVDDELVLRDSDTSLPDPGGVGLVAFREGAHVAWDNLTITPISQLSDPPGLATQPYIEDFADNACRWADQTRMDATVVAYLEQGEYHLQVPSEQEGIQVRCATLGLYRDMWLEVRVSNLTAANQPSAYGVVFRQSADGSTGYILVVNDRGQMSFQKFLAGNADCQPCSLGVAPIPGYLPDKPHLLRLEAEGDQLRGYMDNELILTVEDADIPDAGVLRLGAYLPEAHFVFDNLMISPMTALPAFVTELASGSIAPLVVQASQVEVSLPANAGAAAAMSEISTGTALQNFLLDTTVRFETEDNDQCGFGFRSEMPVRFVWLNISRARVLAYGNEQNQPAQPLLLERLEEISQLDSAELTLVVQDERVSLYLDGQPVKVLVDENPGAGGLFAWVVLSANHAATCRFEDLQVWSLD
jgi:serine/threonine protein kinase